MGGSWAAGREAGGGREEESRLAVRNYAPGVVVGGEHGARDGAGNAGALSQGAKCAEREVVIALAPIDGDAVNGASGGTGLREGECKVRRQHVRRCVKTLWQDACAL